ncbi:uncharacterized protein LOC127860855 [Dreissena polymorpha]|uniref:uncharacterized protein LOC127860855 n=1 Tax=Dreissena polymorpha TaxID=45954 RepID=UPI00226493CB|nr:uncharacterized protein LOC127860855 [Dreissena polymorpha]
MDGLWKACVFVLIIEAGIVLSLSKRIEGGICTNGCFTSCQHKINGFCCNTCATPSSSWEGVVCNPVVECDPPDVVMTLDGRCCPVCVKAGSCQFGSDWNNVHLGCPDPRTIGYRRPLSNCCFLYANNALDKYGLCPTTFPGNASSHECNDDFDCQGMRKCCFNDDVRVCVLPQGCLFGEDFYLPGLMTSNARCTCTPAGVVCDRR